MRRIKSSVFATLLGVLALGAIATASASASECPGTGEGVALCSGGHVQEGTFAFTSKHKAATTDFVTISGVMSLECEVTSGKGNLVATKTHVEITKDVIEWSGCKLPGHASCKVKPFVFGGTSGLGGAIAETGELAEVTFSTTEGKPFGEVSVTGCEQEYEGKITGTQKCTLPHATSEALAHEVSCLSGGSKLTVHTKEVQLVNTEELKLSSGKAFSLQRS